MRVKRYLMVVLRACGGCGCGGRSGGMRRLTVALGGDNGRVHGHR